MSEHEKLVEEVAQAIADVTGDTPNELDRNAARSIIAFIAERTKEATPEMRDAWFKNSSVIGHDARAPCTPSPLSPPPALPTQTQQMESGE